LYRYPTQEQKKIADQWIQLLSIKDIARKPFHQLSYGQKRMILLVRAMVKSPVLLIADEPCLGLDIPNPKRILGLPEPIGHTKTHLPYVTNHKEEVLNCVTHVLRLQKWKVEPGEKRGRLTDIS
jgi:molybdate transport system ATP-binding protein